MEPEVLEHILNGKEKPTNLPFALLKDITAHFSEEREIGHGGFATVYKGILPNGSVAVKRIRNSHTIDEKRFHCEVNCLLTIKHPNIVRFLGFCATTDQTAIKIEGSRQYIYAEIRERLICLEYISNGNLQKHITDELRGLDWSTRYQVIKGICNGLHYLHMEMHIYHMDLKPANILLDNDMVPKITDFGISRLDEKSQTMSADRCASLGYCAPEYLHRGKMSFKSDIYSLGVIITELVTGEKSIPDNNKNNVLRRWRHRWRKTGNESALGYQQVVKCIDIGLLCQEIDPWNRPSILEIMRDINEMEDSNDNESTVGQISPYSDDDMLGVEPLELHFPFELNKEMSCSLDLTNETDSDIAFEVQKTSPLPYCIEPKKGIVPPHSMCSVDITLQPCDRAPQRANEFIVRSTRVNSGFTTEHITTAMSNKCKGNDVDEVNLDVVFDPEVIPGSSALLDVQPLELRFLFEANKLIVCSLDLTNNTDEQVAFGLVKKTPEQTCFLRGLPLFGVVDPGAIYTLALIMDKHDDLPEERNVDLILQTTTYSGILSESENIRDLGIKHFQNAGDSGNTVHKVTLKSGCTLQGEMIFESIPPSIKILSMEDNMHHYGLSCMDANQTEQLIIIGYPDGHVHTWNCDMQKPRGSIKLPAKERPLCVRIIARKGWCLVGSFAGFIHVYDYKKELQKTAGFKADRRFILAVAVHPIQPYVLSAGTEGIKVWDWDHGWKCMQTLNLKDSRLVCAIAFNPEDHNSFASASHDGTIKVWSLDSPNSKYTLSRHSEPVTCLDFFTSDGQQYLITGSDDKTAKIWDMQKKECVCTLPHRSQVLSILAHPKLQILVTGTEDGDVYVWSSISSRLKRTLSFGHCTRVKGLACLNESRRFAVAHWGGWLMIEIRDEEQEGGSSNNKENPISATE